MIDYNSINVADGSLSSLSANLTVEELGKISDEMIDQILGLISDCEDEDVVFVPHDPDAYDPDAETAAEVNMAWTLGHVIVHTTASAEESAALAAEQARGVPNRGGRSRSEVPWTRITTIELCRKRLLESKRMRLASLAMWPDSPHLDNRVSLKRIPESINATDRFLLGLLHEHSHLAQIEEIVSQAKHAKLKLAS